MVSQSEQKSATHGQMLIWPMGWWGPSVHVNLCTKDPQFDLKPIQDMTGSPQLGKQLHAV